MQTWIKVKKTGIYMQQHWPKQFILFYIRQTGVIDESVFVYKNWQFLIDKFKHTYLRELLTSPALTYNKCEKLKKCKKNVKLGNFILKF